MFTDKGSVSGWYMAEGMTAEDKKVPRLVFFYGTLMVSEKTDSFPIRISADGRYRFSVNDCFVHAGPLKGDDHVHFYDTLDISSYLIPGENRIIVCLLVYPENREYGNHSIFRSGIPRLFFTPEIKWQTRIDRTVLFPPEEEDFAPLCIHEIHKNSVCETMFVPSESAPDVGVSLSEGNCPEKPMAAVPCSPDSLPNHLLLQNMRPRDIPFPKKIPHSFAFPQKEIAPHTRKVFVLDAGEEMCAYIRLAMSGGKGAVIELLYSECYTGDGVRVHRENAAQGHLEGYHDIFHVAGREKEEFIPFWLRTFRFIQVTVSTAEEPLTLNSFQYEETGYPLEVKTDVKVSDESLIPVWDISLRTLKRCMHDTYVDCPFYEQLQYVMDTRSEILYTYAVSGDDRLARHAIRDFSRAARPSGLLNCSYPNVNDNIIPGFSLYYIMMVHDHMMYFGDRELIREVLPSIRKILQYFCDHTTDTGLVGKVGGINGCGPHWSFIDWAAQWMDTTGMPPAGLKGPITMESLLYILGLEAAADLCDYITAESPLHSGKEPGTTLAAESSLHYGEEPGRLNTLGEATGEYSELATVYRKRADSVRAAIRALCVREDGMITDGPNNTDISQHGQVFGVLSGVLDSETGRRCIRRSLEEDGITKCSVAMMFYVFRALEQTGLYDCTGRLWDLWRKMVRDGCSTTIEGENYARSECHAWGALALYELPSVILGVRPAAPGYEKILIDPVPGYMTEASGTVHTPRGDVHVSWRLEDGRILTHVDAEEDVMRRVILRSREQDNG